MSKKNWATLKAGWQWVKFGDVVTQVKDRVPDAMASGHTHYVRGEDFVPGQIRLGSRSVLGDGQHGPAFHMQFKKGDVLYVSRNPRLRKAAVADFDGICANTTYVCRSYTAVLLQELLPFIMQTEGFSEYAKRHQRGSTNFYVNWSDIEPYEFALPPLEAQWRMVNVLQAFAEVGERLLSAGEAAKTLKSSITENAFPVSEARSYLNKPESYKGRALAKLGDLATLQVGFPFKSAEYSATGDRLLRGSNVGVNRLLWDSDVTCYWPTERRSEVVDYILKAGDLVIAMDRPFISEGFKIAEVIDSDLPALLLQRVGRFRLSDKITRKYLWAFLHSESFKWQLQRMQKGTDLPHISKFDIEGTLIPLMSLEDQAAVAELFSSTEDASRSLLRRIDANRKQQNAVLLELVVSETPNVH